MHFVVSWDLKSHGARRSELNDLMLKGLEGYEWLRLLPAFYILDVDSERDWQVVHERLLAIAQRHTGEVNFLMSPIYEFDSDYFVFQMPDKDFYHTP